MFCCLGFLCFVNAVSPRSRVRVSYSFFVFILNACVKNSAYLDNEVQKSSQSPLSFYYGDYRPLGTNLIETLNAIQTCLFTKIHLKMSSVKLRPFCLGLNVLNIIRTHNNFSHCAINDFLSMIYIRYSPYR